MFYKLKNKIQRFLETCIFWKAYLETMTGYRRETVQLPWMEIKANVDTQETDLTANTGFTKDDVPDNFFQLLKGMNAIELRFGSKTDNQAGT